MNPASLADGLRVREDRGSRMYHTDPEQKSYGTLKSSHEGWLHCRLNGKNVHKRRKLHAAHYGSFFFWDDELMWHGFTPVGKDEGNGSDNENCWSAFRCI
jgi:hypothetical protein